MKTIVLLAALIAATYATGECMTRTTYQCSATQPANDGTFWSYCPANNLWTKLPCGQLSTYIDYNQWTCVGGYLYRPTGACMNQREEAPEVEQQVLERVTYDTCPISGTTKVYCCPSPSTCHTGSTYTTVCY